MNKIGHIAVSSMFGAAAGVATGAAPAAVLACTGIGGAGGLGPDIDSHNSTATRSLWIVTKGLHKATAGFSGWIYERTKTSEDTADAGGRHRGVTHTLVCTVLIGVLALVAGWFGLPHFGVGSEHAPVLALALTAGWFGHLLGDALTENGVAFFWPLTIRGERWYGVSLPSFLAITGGGIVEKILAALSWTAVTALVAASSADYAGLIDLPDIATTVSAWTT